MALHRRGRHGLARLGVIAANGVPRIRAGKTPQRGKRFTQQFDVDRGQLVKIACNQVPDLLQRGLGEDAAVFAWGAQASASAITRR
jgi:hypothetical protein